MIRFPNPGSDIPSFIRIYKTLYTYLNEKSWFTLDDMSETLTKMNLAASSGHVGEQALALSTRADRSRDPLYNQSKMYAELYRTLGWMVSEAPDTALKFRFTLLGDHAAVADIDPKAIFEESVLGINYPNRILAIKGTEASRVFSTILRAAAKLDGYICRDEIIIGILNNDDVGDEGIDDIVTKIKTLRGSTTRLANAVSELSEQIKIQKNTMQNYTRFPLAVLTYCGWFEKENTKKFYPGGRPTIMFRITEYGQERASELETLTDIRIDDYDSHPTEKQKSLVRLGFYSMLQRSNFDISPAIAQIAKDQNVLRNEIVDDAILFSPYQTIRPEVADNALGHVREHFTDSAVERHDKILAVDKIAHQVTTIKLSQISGTASTAKAENAVAAHILSLIQAGKSNKEIADILHVENAKSTQAIFYPLISDLFRIVGFNCQVSRAGINYERWDAIAIDDNHSIPIEIKSPTEEWHISIKAVRQALENKVILLSRKSYATDWDTVSLAVGYNLPNDRAEVSRLIADIKNTFNVKIGVIDFRSLLTIASAALRGDKENRVDQIRQMEGLINVESV